MDKYGTCLFCGQRMIAEGDEAERNHEATMSCSCKEGRPYRIRMGAKIEAEDKINTLFEEDFEQMEDVRVKNMLIAMAELIVDRQLDRCSVRFPSNVIATISYYEKTEGVKVVRKETKTTEA